jgi:hypothetical protein
MARRVCVPFLVVMLAACGLSLHAVAAESLVAATPPADATPDALSPATAILLTQEQVPAGLVMTDDRERSLDEVTAGFPLPAAARAQFKEWGWKGNHVRAFHTPQGAKADPAHIDGIYISVHEFGSADGAAKALDYSVTKHASGAKLEEIRVAPMGDRSVALSGTMPYGKEVTIYVQRSSLLIRLSASSPKGDPTAQAVALMQTMLQSPS